MGTPWAENTTGRSGGHSSSSSTKTAPFSHSGGEPDLAGAIRAHVDPLAEVDTSRLSALDRAEVYQKIARWSLEPSYAVELSDAEIADLVAFLAALEFDPEPVR